MGGFFDAGDFDIETGSNINVVQNFIRTWELFKPQRDETFVSQEQRYVELHRPDGKADILQFIEHGTLNLVAQAEQIGHMAQTLSNSVLDNYHHLGDMATNLQLYRATQEKQYLNNFTQQIWDALELGLANNMQTALDAIPTITIPS